MSQYLGDISAYALAVSQGYTGTEEEYAELMASYATVGQTAVTAAQTATTKASEAATSATTATNKATEATTAATTATNKAAEAQADADAAALDASQALSAASTATTKATEATTAAATATSAKTDAVAANTAAQSAKTAAQTAQTGAETAAASVQASAAQIQTNADDISELKEDLADIVTLGNLVIVKNLSYNKTLANGELSDSVNNVVSDFFNIEDFANLYASQRPLVIAFYDASKNYLWQLSNAASPISTTNYGNRATFCRVAISSDNFDTFAIGGEENISDLRGFYPTTEISGIDVSKQITDYNVLNSDSDSVKIDHVVFAGCAGRRDYLFTDGADESFFVINSISTTLDIRLYPVATLDMIGVAQIALSLYVPDASLIESATLSLLGTSFNRSLTGLHNGWNRVILNTWEGALTNWNTATAIRVYASGSAGISLYVAKIRLIRPEKANLIIVEDGGYSSFLEQAYPKFKNLGVPITWALNPGRLGVEVGNTGHVLTQEEIDSIASDACSEFSFHSWNATPTAAMEAIELQEDASKCIRYLYQKGLAPAHLWRAAHTQNLAENASAERGFVEALATGTATTSYTVFPFPNRYNVPRIPFHGRSASDYTTMFDTLKKTHCTAVIYTHGVSTSSTDISTAMLDEFISQLSTAINEGWINPTTYNRLRNENLIIT